MAALGRCIVMLGYAGARTALTLAELHREEVQKRFPKHFLKQEAALHRAVRLLSEPAKDNAKQSNEASAFRKTSIVCELQQGQGLSEGCWIALQEDEVFPALWKLAEGLDAGLDAELRKIPVLQYVIEISELFDANPYVNMTALENKKCFGELFSDAGRKPEETAPMQDGILCGTKDFGAETIYSLLIATDKPEKVIAFAEANELPAAVIGRLTDKNDRVVRNGEISRYLTPEG